MAAVVKVTKGEGFLTGYYDDGSCLSEVTADELHRTAPDREIGIYQRMIFLPDLFPEEFRNDRTRKMRYKITVEVEEVA